MPPNSLGGRFALAGTSISLNRMGYGAMRLSGPHVFGPPADVPGAIEVLRAAVDAGVNHIDTADFYGPHVTNRIIREALHPYPDDLTLITKIGWGRGQDGSWHVAQSRDELMSAVHDNLRNLGLDALDVVNLRLGGPISPEEGPVEAPVAVLADLQRRGLVRHIGISNSTHRQYEEARRVVDIVCVQNQYNLAHRGDDAFIDELAAAGVAYVPFFPLGGFSPLQSSTLGDVAAGLGATTLQVALAWLLHRSPNVLLIPGTSSIGHLRENLSATSLTLPPKALKRLDHIAAEAGEAAQA